MDKTKAEKSKLFNDYIVENMDSAINFANIYVKSRQDAEDVVSESIEKALRRIHTFREPYIVKSWFYRIIINTSIDYIKKQPNTISTSEYTKAWYWNDLSRLEFEDLLKIVSDDEERKILYLRFFEDLDLNDISETLGMNLSTVKSKLYRSLDKLKLEIDENGYGLKVKVRKRRSMANKAIMLTIVIFLSIVSIFNLFPSLTAAAYDIPVIGDIIRIITFNRFEYKEGNYEAEIFVPEIRGLLEPELQDKINADFREHADDLIRSFEETLLELEALGLDEQDDLSTHMSIKADYVVKTDNDRVLSIDAYIYSDTANYVIHKFCTIDKSARKLVNLSDLFKSNADYVTAISSYLVEEMLRLNREEGGTYSVGDTDFAVFTEIKAEQNFFINEDGKLVICFDKYEIAAGFQGSPEFVIPYEIIADIVSSDLIS